MRLIRPDPKDRVVVPRFFQRHECPFSPGCQKPTCIRELPMLGHLDDTGFEALAKLEKRLRELPLDKVRQEYYLAKLRLMAIIATRYIELKDCGIAIEIVREEGRTPLEGFPFLPGFAHVTKLEIDGAQVAGREVEILERDRQIAIQAELQEGAVVLLAIRIMREAADKDREILTSNPIEDLDLEMVVSAVEKKLKAA